MFIVSIIRKRILISNTNLQFQKSGFASEMHRKYYNHCSDVTWSSRVTHDSSTLLASVPLSIFPSNSKFDENSERSSFEYTRPITTIFCTRHAVTLSWRVQNIVVIGRVCFTLECFEFSSNFEFDRNMLSGTGAYWSFVREFTADRFNSLTNAINAKSVTISWRHHDFGLIISTISTGIILRNMI